jgi:predicted  nucleic acid-binding Zn-ribbon protein
MQREEREVEELAELIWRLCRDKPLVGRSKLAARNLAKTLITAAKKAGVREVDWEGEVIQCDLSYSEQIGLFHRWLREHVGRIKPLEEYFKSKKEIDEYAYHVLVEQLKDLLSKTPEEAGLSSEEYEVEVEKLRSEIEEYEKRLKKPPVKLPPRPTPLEKRIEELKREVSELERESTILVEKGGEVESKTDRVFELLRLDRLCEALAEGKKAIREVDERIREIEAKLPEARGRRERLIRELRELRTKVTGRLLEEVGELLGRAEKTALPEIEPLRDRLTKLVKTVEEAREKAREKGRRLLDDYKRIIEEKLREQKAKIYRLDPADEEYCYLAARISYYRVHDEAVKKVLGELEATIVEEREAPPLKIILVDFRRAKIPVKPPAVAPEVVEKKWREMVEYAKRLVEEWIRLYVKPEKAVGVRMALERALREVEGDVKELLKAGKPELAEEEFKRALEDVAKTVVSIAPKAREHPEIQRLLPELKRPPTAIGIPVEELPPEMWTAAMKPPGLGREAWKWARFFAKLERMATRIPSIYERPSLEGHPNPWISQFPPGGVVKEGFIYLHPTCATGLAKIAETAGVKVNPADYVRGVSVEEFKRLIDAIYPKVSESAREWLNLLRSGLGI